MSPRFTFTARGRRIVAASAAVVLAAVVLAVAWPLDEARAVRIARQAANLPETTHDIAATRIDRHAWLVDFRRRDGLGGQNFLVEVHCLLFTKCSGVIYCTSLPL